MQRFFAWVGLGLLVAGCDDNLWGVGEVLVEPPSQEGYAGVIEISQDACLGCHSAGSALGGLDLETNFAAATVGVLGQYGLLIVEPGNPDGSLLYLKMTNTQPGGVGTDMPPGSGGLDPALTDVVKAWIEDGAPAQ